MRKIYKTSLAIVSIAFGSIVLSEYAIGDSSGPSTAASGDPKSGGTTCAKSGCHTGLSVSSASGWITSNIPSSGYIPGSTYVITATAVGSVSSKTGFQVTPQNSDGTVVGTLAVSDATNTKLVNGGNYITHKLSGTALKTWSFNWTAPAGTSGSVTFYGSFNRSNNDGYENVSMGGTAPDTIYTSTATFLQDPTTSIESYNSENSNVIVSPNPAVDYIAIQGDGLISIAIIDLSGNEVKAIDDATDNQKIYISDLNSGTYLVRVKTSDGVSYKKFVKN